MENKFIEKMVDILDSEEEITMDSVLANIEEWDSLSIVSFLAMANTVFGKKIQAIDVRNAKTVNDLFELVNN